jgi:hypothetical protein
VREVGATTPPWASGLPTLLRRNICTF